MSKQIVLLSVGINKYDNFQSLGLCGKDSISIASAFKRRRPDLNSIIINDVDRPVTISTIKNEINKIKIQTLSHDDLVIFFFAGHGFSGEGKDYIAAKDTALDDLETAISTDEIINALKSSNAGTIVLIIDACRKEVSRSPEIFGERTAEISRRKGITTFFSCSPGETAKELSLIDNGVFTYSFKELMNESIPFTPYVFNSRLIKSVTQLCKEHKLDVQTPYTSVAPLEKAMIDLITGETHYQDTKEKQMILVVGPSNAGKTSIGKYIANKYGYVHAEMSSFAWNRFNSYNTENNFMGTLQEFMEDEVWKNGDEDIIAKDLISAYRGIDKIVVCGARRPEEIETIVKQGWNVSQIFVFANSSVRFKRLQNQSDRYGPNYKEFIKKDLLEFGWGMAKMPSMKNMELVINENSLETYYLDIERIIKISANQ